MRMHTRAVRVLGIVLGLGIAPHGVALAADGGTDAGGCASSLECRLPTPYCHPTLGTCVECLGDRNCPSGKTCDEGAGVCYGCLVHADCSYGTPYCDTAAHECVQCLTTANCADLGVACTDGKCGSCGDGICASNEGILVGTPGSFPGAPEGYPTTPTQLGCPDDCAAACPTKSVGSALGTFSVPVAGLKDLYTTYCANSGTVEATFAWTAPSTGDFAFETNGSSISILEEGCAGYDNGCGGSGFGIGLSEGQEIVLVVESGPGFDGSIPTELSLTVSRGTGGGCGFFGCPPSTGDGGGGNEQGKALCLANAQDRGDPICAGVDCACDHCPEDYDDCAVIPGCSEIRACMAEKGCIATDCYNSGACRSIIDSLGGVSGPAFGASARLQSCSLTFACSIPCGDAGAADAGSKDAAAPDAGQLCEPGREVACTCEGGTGTKTCESDGNGFGACVCGSSGEKKDDGGCGCRVPQSRRPASRGTWALLGLLGFTMLRFRRGARR